MRMLFSKELWQIFRILFHKVKENYDEVCRDIQVSEDLQERLKLEKKGLLVKIDVSYAQCNILAITAELTDWKRIICYR